MREIQVWIGFAPAALGEVKPDGTVRLYKREEGITGIVTALYEDSDGQLWIATDDSIMRLDTDHFLKATPAEQRDPQRRLSAIVEDNEGFLWIGAPSGLVRIHKSEFDKLGVEPSHELAYILYSTADGLDGTPLWIGTPGGARAGDGRLWFVTGSGVALVDPARFQTSSNPFPSASKA